MRTVTRALLLFLFMTNIAQASCLMAFNPELRGQRPGVIFIPTPPEIATAALELANVNKGDFLYDLGSGDGRVLVTAAKKWGTRGVGLDIDLQRLKEANESILANRVSDLVQVGHADFFKTDMSEATVVFLYLLPSLNVRLLPKLMTELKPGTRIVSHAFDFAGVWTPEVQVEMHGRQVFLWRVPESPTERNRISREGEALNAPRSN